MRSNRNARGLIADEIYTRGATQTRRDYSYDGRGVLTLAITGSDVATYSYTASGLPDTISDTAGSRTVHRTSSTLAVGDVMYTWDAAGRVVGKGEWTFAYGANGQLVRARSPDRQIDFVYDDADQRLLKRVDGAPVLAHVAGSILTEDHFVEPITIGGVVVGVLDNGQFTALLTDLRGTPFAGPNGTPGMATPYGVRTSHLGLAEVIDYTRLGWDPDLDVVRMGVRDYDPHLSQFLTPDPLYFEDLEKCQASPLQCALYGYASGNPVSFVDPDGQDGREENQDVVTLWFGDPLLPEDPTDPSAIESPGLKLEQPRLDSNTVVLVTSAVALALGQPEVAFFLAMTQASNDHEIVVPIVTMGLGGFKGAPGSPATEVAQPMSSSPSAGRKDNRSIES